MANLSILKPIETQAGWLSQPSANINGAFPLANLIDPDPKLVCRSANVSASFSVDIDVQADQPVDQAFVGYTNASAGATWEIRAATSAQGAGYLGNAGSVQMAAATLRVTDSRGPRHHGLWTRLAGPVSARYWRITVSDAANGAGFFEAGILALGSTYSTALNIEEGRGRRPLDLSVRTRLGGGGLVIGTQAIVPRLSFTLAEMTDAELRAAWALLSAVGLSRACLVVEDPAAVAGLADQIHWGTFAEINEYARAQADRTAWDLVFEDWL